MIPPRELVDYFKREDDFLIATHYSPDADGLGAALALSMALGKLGKSVLLLDKDPVPLQCRFMPGSGAFLTFENLPPRTFGNLVIVDCNSPLRISSDKARIANLKFRFSAVIDHHESESSFGDIRWIVPEAPATGMMIFELIKGLGLEPDRDMATDLYAALAVDTGNFRHENTTADALRIASELAAAGAKPYAIVKELYDSWSDGRFRLFVKVLDTLQTEDGIAVSVVTKKLFEETSATAEDTENFVEFPRIMKSVSVSVLFREIGEDHYKVSLRSCDGVNVARVAEEFKGGGHKNAAGCAIKADLETAKTQVLEKLRKLRISESKC